MQAVVLVEFLVTGMAMVIAVLAWHTPSWQDHLRIALSGPTETESARVAVFLGFCYASGIVSNFAIYYPLQKRVIRPFIRKYIVHRFKALGHDLVAETNAAAGLVPAKSGSGDLALSFLFMRDLALKDGQSWLDKSSDYQRGLQRLTRGLIIPAVVLIKVYWSALTLDLHWVLVSAVLVALALLVHAINAEDEDVVRAFLLSNRKCAQAPAKPIGNVAPSPAQAGAKPMP